MHTATIHKNLLYSKLCITFAVVIINEVHCISPEKTEVHNIVTVLVVHLNFKPWIQVIFKTSPGYIRTYTADSLYNGHFRTR